MCRVYREKLYSDSCRDIDAQNVLPHSLLVVVLDQGLAQALNLFLLADVAGDGLLFLKMNLKVWPLMCFFWSTLLAASRVLQSLDSRSLDSRSERCLLETKALHTHKKE